METRHYKINQNELFLSVWAPYARDMKIKFVNSSDVFPMHKGKNGYWNLRQNVTLKNSRYFFLINEKSLLPDPASHFQPHGVHGPSELIDHESFKWNDSGFINHSLSDYVIYEIHTGTFTEKGTFAEAMKKLPYLKRLGINAIELMPVAQFPGTRNWGYDGTYLYSVQNSYGGPQGLKKFINAAHYEGIAVILDVVYNHFGPEGNYLWNYGPYFTDKYKTPWGEAINFDGKNSHYVRNFFIQNAIHWIKNYHVDALRLDAIHGIFDSSKKHILREINENVEKYAISTNRKVYLIAESDLNDVIIINSYKKKGYGLSAQWSDDFHHSLHALLTKEKRGYYRDFGSINHIEKAYKEGFVYSGEYSKFRNKCHGTSSKKILPSKFVIFSQNHDQVGNRMLGERSSSLVPYEALMLLGGATLLSPYIPLIFMGEEYGETSPFLYFMEHSDKNLINAVRQGRKKEFRDFGWGDSIPDPQSQKTFNASKLNWKKNKSGRYKALLKFYKTLISLRKKSQLFSSLKRDKIKTYLYEKKLVLCVELKNSESQILKIMNFSSKPKSVILNDVSGNYISLLNSYDKKWLKDGFHTEKAFLLPAKINLMPYHFILLKMDK